MQGTIITLPSRGPPVGKTINESPTLERLKAAVGGGDIELVPGFDTIEYAGEIVPCVAFCEKESKLKSRPINHDATVLWDAALVRAGYPGLLKPGGRMADMLFGQIAVVCGDADFMAAPPPNQ